MGPSYLVSFNGCMQYSLPSKVGPGGVSFSLALQPASAVMRIALNRAGDFVFRMQKL